jgi:hypothetical protein
MNPVVIEAFSKRTLQIRDILDKIEAILDATRATSLRLSSFFLLSSFLSFFLLVVIASRPIHHVSLTIS